MSAHNRLQILLFLLSFCYACIIATDKFHEELLLKSLETGHVSSYFRFTTLSEINGENNTSQCKKISTSTVTVSVLVLVVPSVNSLSVNC